MPSINRPCNFCGETIKSGHMSRHLKRWHSEENPDDTSDEGLERSLYNNVSRASSEKRRSDERSGRSSLPKSEPVSVVSNIKPSVPSSGMSRSGDGGKVPDSVSNDYVRDAVLCMLRRTTGNNLQSLTSYLETYFPDIPRQSRTCIIIAAFAAAQKVAATHVDVMLGVDEERVSWGKKSIARWIHGLGAVEPRQNNYEHSGSQQSKTPPLQKEVYSPRTNYLVTKEMPVSINSAYAQAQMATSFENDHLLPQKDSSTTTEPSIGVQFDSDVEPDNPGENDVDATVSMTDAVLASVAISAVASADTIVTSMPIVTFETEKFVSEDRQETEMSSTIDSAYQSERPRDSMETSASDERRNNDQSNMMPEYSQSASPGLMSDMGESFNDLLEVHDVNSLFRSELSRPLLLLSPIQTPPELKNSDQNLEGVGSSASKKLDTRESGVGEMVRKKKSESTVKSSNAIHHDNGTENASESGLDLVQRNTPEILSLKEPHVSLEQSPEQSDPVHIKLAQALSSSDKENLPHRDTESEEPSTDIKRKLSKRLSADAGRSKEFQSTSRESPKRPRVVRPVMSEVYRPNNYRGREYFRVPENLASGTRCPVMPSEEFSGHEKRRDSYWQYGDNRSYDRHYADRRSRFNRPSDLSEMEKRWLQRMPQAWRY